jgi:uncharacterized protein YejL (UPF0352 family)
MRRQEMFDNLCKAAEVITDINKATYHVADFDATLIAIGNMIVEILNEAYELKGEEVAE